ncbi:phytanoyl-CoA dioxygenase family protein [Tenacibaculum maritimum]|uniref:phytanoyl-CoA dioxygenase family protein n=1 Tax=Tenacibaculum maritimum TaxID=107401 RepID=UPI0013304F32|nr:phytanoyl-CoA dioxygenase family protein [Tenacibaculum maritimum]
MFLEKMLIGCEKNEQLGGIPLREVLEKNITFRIYLEEAKAIHGALRVLPNRHIKGKIRIEESFKKEVFGTETPCTIQAGGVMLMKLLLLHASSKSIAEKERRSIHLEFCN